MRGNLPSELPSYSYRQEKHKSIPHLLDDLHLHNAPAQSQSRNLMSLPVVQATAEANIAIPFHQSLGKSSAEGDPCFSNLAIRFPTDSPEAAAPSFSIGPPEPSARR